MKQRAMGAGLENIAKDYIRFPALTKEAPRGDLMMQSVLPVLKVREWLAIFPR